MGAEKEFKNGDKKGFDRYGPVLSTNQRIWLLFLLPTAFCCVVYIADIATDVALVERHFAEERRFSGAFTLVLIYLPSIAFFVMTLVDPKKRPGPEANRSEKFCWILKKLALLVFFPIYAIHRFAGKLFWSLEALICPESEKEDALSEASKPSPAELYLLLQAFFQAVPQALLQTYILASFKIPHERTGTVQFLGITTSIASAAIAASLYMRFESQRLAGRKTPWSEPDRDTDKTGIKSKMSLMTTIESQITADTIADDLPRAEVEKKVEKPESPKQPQLPKGVPQSAILSLPPLPPEIRARLIKASGDVLPDDLQKDYEGNVEGEALNIRSSIFGPEAKSPQKEKNALEETSSELEATNSLSPAPSLPEVPPPPLPFPFDVPLDEEASERDDGCDADSEGKAENRSLMDRSNDAEIRIDTSSPSAERSPALEKAVEEHLSREPLIEDEATPKHFQPIPLPTRKWKVEGLAEDDFLGKFIGFIWWFLFVTSRVLALATLAFFYPPIFGLLFLLHYFGMLFYLFNCEKSNESSATLLRIALGFVYVFCFVEIRTRFKNPNLFALVFALVGLVENTISSSAWYFFADWTSWWFLYAFFFIITSMILSILSMALYFLILKPPTQDIYTN